MVLNLTEASIKVDCIMEDLLVSMEKEQVEDIFFKNSIDDKSERIRLLRKCMDVVDTSNTNDPISVDDEYADELAIFLNGKWRLLI
jgi:hypothetical protein